MSEYKTPYERTLAKRGYCRSLNSNGDPCRQAPMIGSDYCVSHSPGKLDAWRARMPKLPPLPALPSPDKCRKCGATGPWSFRRHWSDLPVRCRICGKAVVGSPQVMPKAYRMTEDD